MKHRMHRNSNAAAPREKVRPLHRLGRREWVVGTMIEIDQAEKALTVRVEDAGRAERVGSEMRIDAASARISATDGDGDGRPSLTDLFPGDRVHVGLRADDPPSAARIALVSAGGPPGGLRRLWADRG